MVRLARYDALALTALIWFLAKFVRYLFPPLFGTLQGEYGVSNAVLGTAFTGLMLAYAAMQFPSGALADRVGGVRVVVAGALVAAGAALALATPLPFAALVAGMALIGVGTGAHKTVAVRLTATIYPERTGRALGVLDTLGAFGGVVAPAAVVWAVGREFPGVDGWRAVFLATALAGVTLAVLFGWRVPRRTAGGTGGVGTASPSLGEYAVPFADRRFATFVAVTVLFAFGYNGAVAFLPLYLTEVAGLSTATAGGLYSVLFLVSVVQVFTGEASDAAGRFAVLAATIGLATVGLAALVAVPAASLPVLAGAVVVFGVGSHGYRPVRSAYTVELLPDATAGGGLGVVRTFIMGVGAVAPAVVGVVADASGFDAAFGVLLTSLVGSGLLLVAFALMAGD